MAIPSLLRIPKPKSFFYLMSLRTGTELIALTLLFNKMTGFYGLLSLLTGVHLSSVQLSMYVYSLLALGLAATLAPHIRQGYTSPLQNLALAWLYVVDSIINVTYTAVFGLGWFLVLAQHQSPALDGETAGHKGPGGRMMGEAAGFVNPTFTVDSVEVVATAAAGSGDQLLPQQDHVLIGHSPNIKDAGSANPGPGALHTTILEKGSIASITTIVVLWIIRFYFILVIMAYARAVLRQHIVAQSQATTGFPPAAETPTKESNSLYAENPFREGTRQGEGWRGRLGRIMVGLGRGYWLGVEEGEHGTAADWEQSIGAKFARRQSRGRSMPEDGNHERERRRRRGTGPPILRPIELDNIRR